MIKNFRHKVLERFFQTDSKRGIQPKHAGKLRLQLTALDHAVSAKDLNAPGWRLHPLSSDLRGFSRSRSTAIGVWYSDLKAPMQPMLITLTITKF